MLGPCCCVWAFSNCSEWRLILGFSLWWPPFLHSTGSRAHGLQYLWQAGSVALWDMVFSWTRIEFVSPALAGRFLNHWSTKQVLICLFDEIAWSCPGPTCTSSLRSGVPLYAQCCFKTTDIYSFIHSKNICLGPCMCQAPGLL